MKINRSTIIQWLKVILPVLLMLFAIRELGKIIKEANGEAIATQLGAVDGRTLILIALIPLALTFPMFFYDFFIMKKLKIKIALKSLMKQSLIINSFSNLIGFGGLVGVLLRTHYFKKPEMKNGPFFKTITSVTLFSLSGISLFSDILVLFFRDLPLFNEHPFLLIVAGFIGLYIPFLIIKAIVQLLMKKVTWKAVAADGILVLVSIAEWTCAFLMLFILTRLLHIDITVGELWPVFIIATAAGIVSMIPGGLGSFDLVFIWGATTLHASSETILVLLLFYRVSYYAIPFTAGLLLFIRDIWHSFNIGYNSIPKVLLEKTTHIIATALVFLAGLALLISSVAPGAIEKLKYVREITALPFINVSHQVSVITGFALLALSNGISYKDKRSYTIALFVLLFAAALFILKGVQYRQSLFMIFVALLLYFSKNRFYRRSYIETWGRGILNTVIISIIILSYVILGVLKLDDSRYELPHSLQVLLIPQADDLFKSALIGLAVIVFVVLIEIWVRKKRQYKHIFAKQQQAEIMQHILNYGGKEAFHFAENAQQYVYWNKKKTVLFPYRVSADKLIVLGDLIGDKNDFKQSIEEFIEHADLYCYTPIFYEVSNQFIPYLYGYGYNFFRLGEEGFINIEHFTDWMNKDERFKALLEKKKEYRYEQLYAPFTYEFIEQLATLSNDWQAEKDKKEDSSLFNKDYLSNGPVSLLRNAEGEMVVFANLMPLYDEKKTLVISLIRSRGSELPVKVVDYLLLKIILAAKKANYERINVGMTYLKHVGVSKYAGISEKIAAQILVDGQEQTGRSDVQRLKEIYTDEWQPKYIAYRKKAFLPITMVQIMMLIGNNKLSNKRNQFVAMRNAKKN